MVMDFGLAKDLYSNSMVSMTGDIMGTPAYMSPEQAGGHVSATGERSDVYSLGAILYCMLTKEPPFRGNTLMETLGRVMNEDPPPLVNVNPMIEGELGAICMKAMEKVPSMRYKSAAEMARDLRAFINGQPISAKPWTWRTRMHRWILRHRLELAGGVVATTLFFRGLSRDPNPFERLPGCRARTSAIGPDYSPVGSGDYPRQGTGGAGAAAPRTAGRGSPNAVTDTS